MYRRDAAVARTALRRLLDDPIQEWLEAGPALIDAAQGNCLAAFDDPSISLVDAVSFEVMAREGIAAAFAFDHHFEVAGYALLGA